MSYLSRIQEVQDLKRKLAEHRRLLFKLRKNLLRSGNCPICGGADFDKKKRIVAGKHEAGCFYDELMEFKA